jgi:hypothetical protein
VIFASLLGVLWIFQVMGDTRWGMIESAMPRLIIGLLLIGIIFYALGIPLGTLLGHQPDLNHVIGVGLVIPPVIVCLAASSGLIRSRWRMGKTPVDSAVAIAGVLALRFFTTFFGEMVRYPAFDLLALIATLILPWLSAIPLLLDGYTLILDWKDSFLHFSMRNVQ